MAAGLATRLDETFHGIDTIKLNNGEIKTMLNIKNLEAVVIWSDDAREYRKALSQREGGIVRLICSLNFEDYLVFERHTCIDTTAAGGNAALLAL